MRPHLISDIAHISREFAQANTPFVRQVRNVLQPAKGLQHRRVLLSPPSEQRMNVCKRNAVLRKLRYPVQAKPTPLADNRQHRQQVANFAAFEVIAEIETRDTPSFQVTRKACQRAMRAGQYGMIPKSSTAAYGSQNRLGDAFRLRLGCAGHIKSNLASTLSPLGFQPYCG